MNKQSFAATFLVAALAALTLVACDSNGDARRLGNLVSVADANYTSLVINTGGESAVIETGEVTQLSLEAFAEGSETGVVIGSGSAAWRSSDSLIAEVDPDTGSVLGGAVDGEVTITATFGNLLATTQVRVSSAQLVSIDIESVDDSFSLNECSSGEYVAWGNYEGEEQRRNITDSVEWEVVPADGSGITAAFDEAGVLRVTAAGVLAVSTTRLAFLDKPEVASAITEVTVADSLEGIEIEADAGELSVASPLQYRGYPVYSNEPDQRPEISDYLSWNIAATSGRFDAVVNGLVTASEAGDGVLTAGCNGTGITESVAISAAGSGLFAGLTITAANADREFPLTVIWQGERITERLTATALYADQDGGEDVTDEANWLINSAPDGIFTLGNDNDNKGELIIRGRGRVTLTATYTDDNDVRFPATVTVISR